MSNSEAIADAPEIRFAGFEGACERKRLGGLAKSFEYGLNAPAIPFDGIHTYIRITDIDDTTRTLLRDRLTSPGADLSSCSDYLVQQGDVLFARTGASTGKTYLVRGHEGAAFFAGFLIRMRALDSASSSFVYYSTFTKAYSKFISIASQRSGQPGVNAGQYSNWDLIVPSLPEQEAIGSLFSKLDSLIGAEGDRLAALRATRESMLARMFPREGESVPEVRFAGFEGAWERKRLGEVGTSYSGLSGKTKGDFGHGSARFVPYTNVFDNPVSDPRRLELTEVDPKQNAVRYGDALFTVSSETPEEVGMSSVWLSDLEDVYLNSFCFGYRQDGTFDSLYLAYMLRSRPARKQLALLAQGISRYNISKNRVMELPVPVPSLPEQRAIGSFFSRLDALIEAQGLKVEALGRVKKSLLDEMFC